MVFDDRFDTGRAPGFPGGTGVRPLSRETPVERARAVRGGRAARFLPALAALCAVGASSLSGQAAVCPDPTALTEGLDPPFAHVRYLADDALEGRASGSAGERCAAEYIASVLAAAGLKGGGDGGSFFQSFPVRGGAALGTHNLLRAMEGGGAELDIQWRPYGFSATGHAAGPSVHGGHGIGRPGSTDEGYGALALEGRLVVVEDGDPLSPAGTSLESQAHYKASEAARRGAAGLVVLMADGADLPELAGETRPRAAIPVAAVRGAAAEALRATALAGGDIELMAELQPRTLEARNVVARLPGSEEGRRGEVVVVGAHYDHLGLGGAGSLAPGNSAIHNGADDNASGTAALLEVATRLARAPLRPARSIDFVAFSGEEMGLLGSQAYVESDAFSAPATIAMINMDMVGRLADDRLTVFGAGTAEEWPPLLSVVNASLDRPLDLALNPDGFGPSDHSSFYGKGVPVLHFFTNTHMDYHRPSDDWERVEAEGLERVTELVAAVTAALAGGPSHVIALTPVADAGAPPAPPPPARNAPSEPVTSGYGPYLGTIPDMSLSEGGVRLTGVREASPAAIAGLRAGDVIVAFGGREIGDLYEYTYALRAHAPGDQVEIVVLREGERVTLSAVLGRR